MHVFYEIMQSMAANSSNDLAERLRILREVCESDCINTILPACAPLNQVAAYVLADILGGKFQLNVYQQHMLS